MNIILYGPPGAGKSAVGRALAAKLGREFADADSIVEMRAGLTVAQIFSQSGEAEFRRLESGVCAELAARQNLVIALGGGALLDRASRAALERGGVIICLRAEPAALLARLPAEGCRPLLADGDPAEKLHALLASRRALYDSFPVQIDTTNKTIAQVVSEIGSLLTPRTLAVEAADLQHEILLGYGLLENLPALLSERNLHEPLIVVTDEKIARALPFVMRHSSVVTLPAGEQHKTLATVSRLYDEFLNHGLERSGAVIAIGGGVIGDLTGFAAATFMRGVRWVNVPTTLLAMVDAAIGGKTGVDLPQGKNLVGAFHPPSLVAADPLALGTLPAAERIAGMAEVVKHGIIGCTPLFESLERAEAFGSLEQLRQAMEVKIKIVEADPFEKGERAKLNLGHTIGHGIEAASGYALRHGEAVSIGLAAEARLAERIGLAESGLAVRIERALSRIGLPTRCPDLDPVAIRAAMNADKKKSGGQLRFALPKKIGDVVWGIEVDESDLDLEGL